MNVDYCLNCPFFYTYSHHHIDNELWYHGAACRPARPFDVKVLFHVTNEGEVNYYGMHEKCPSKLEHMFLEDDTKEFAGKDYKVIEDIIEKKKEKRKIKKK